MSLVGGVAAVRLRYLGSAPTASRLEPNYPNPFNPTTAIRYDLKADGVVSLRVYGVNGQPVRTIVSAAQRAGPHAAQWDGRDEVGRVVSSGVYLYELRVGEFAEVRRMLLMK